MAYRQEPFSLPWLCYPTEYSNLDDRKSKHIDGDSITHTHNKKMYSVVQFQQLLIQLSLLIQ
jgi:hypothetical protein